MKSFPIYAILADTPEGETVKCFTWRRDAASGVRSAIAEARAFGHRGYTNFRAVPAGCGTSASGSFL